MINCLKKNTGKFSSRGYFSTFELKDRFINIQEQGSCLVYCFACHSVILIFRTVEDTLPCVVMLLGQALRGCYEWIYDEIA